MGAGTTLFTEVEADGHLKKQFQRLAPGLQGEGAIEGSYLEYKACSLPAPSSFHSSYHLPAPPWLRGDLEQSPAGTRSLALLSSPDRLERVPTHGARRSRTSRHTAQPPSSTRVSPAVPLPATRHENWREQFVRVRSFVHFTKVLLDRQFSLLEVVNAFANNISSWWCAHCWSQNEALQLNPRFAHYVLFF